jgi:hypothetical protein
MLPICSSRMSFSTTSPDGAVAGELSCPVATGLHPIAHFWTGMNRCPNGSATITLRSRQCHIKCHNALRTQWNPWLVVFYYQSYAGHASLSRIPTKEKYLKLISDCRSSIDFGQRRHRPAPGKSQDIMSVLRV